MSIRFTPCDEGTNKHGIFGLEGPDIRVSGGAQKGAEFIVCAQAALAHRHEIPREICVHAGRAGEIRHGLDHHQRGIRRRPGERPQQNGDIGVVMVMEDADERHQICWKFQCIPKEINRLHGSSAAEACGGNR